MSTAWRNSSDHHKLDNSLTELLQLLRLPANTSRIKTHIATFAEDRTWDKVPENYRPGTFFRPKWRSDRYMGKACFSYAWLSDLGLTQHEHDSLVKALQCMLEFLIDGSTPYECTELACELTKTVERYLDKRGLLLPEPSVVFEGAAMFELLAAIRRLRTALDSPFPDPDSSGMTRLPLSEADADRAQRAITTALKTPDVLPAGVEMKLRCLLPVWNLSRYVESIDEANGQRRRDLNTVREIEAALTGRAVATQSLVASATGKTVAEAAKLLEVDPATVNRWVHKGKLTGVPGAKPILIEAGSVLKLLETKKASAETGRAKTKRPRARRKTTDEPHQDLNPERPSPEDVKKRLAEKRQEVFS